MKTIAITILTLFYLSGISQTADAFNELPGSEVPSKVQNSFEKLNPKVELDSWRIAKRIYEAKYKKDDFWTYSRFNKEGLFLETRILKDWGKYSAESLKAGKQKTNYKYWKVIEYYEVTKSDHSVYYVIQLEDKGNLITLYMDQDGSLQDISNTGY